ncbi:titin-like isoform X2 [Artemia franciscana]|uniref:Uncharacterized protein n=2 Tax=Artemia franciscana TaxID=6661 RepID=A0AA88HZI8_ARTSF|nr:hypothetical protein QYM36_009473 [Artemia franciscana]
MATTVTVPLLGTVRKNGAYSFPPNRTKDGYNSFGSSEEELEYGPGIVNKLRSRFLNKTVSDQDKQKSTLRRTASLEDWLDKDTNGFLSPSPTATEPIIRNNVIKACRPVSVDSARKADHRVVIPFKPPLLSKRSVSTSDLRSSSNRNKLVPFKEVVIVEDSRTPPVTTIAPVILPPEVSLPTVPKVRRVSTNTRYGMEVSQLPPPDTVKQVKRMFEEKKPSDNLSGKGSREGSPAPVNTKIPSPPKAPEIRKITPPPRVMLGPRGFSKPVISGPKPVITAPKFGPGSRPFRQTVRSIPTPPRMKEIILISHQDSVDFSQNKLSENKTVMPPVKRNNINTAGNESAANVAKLRNVVQKSEANELSRITRAEPKKSLIPAPSDNIQNKTQKPVAQITAQTQNEHISQNALHNNGGDVGKSNDVDSADGAFKRVEARALENIRNEGESVSFNFNKSKSAIKSTDKKVGVIRPTVQKQENRTEKEVKDLQQKETGQEKQVQIINQPNQKLGNTTENVIETAKKDKLLEKHVEIIRPAVQKVENTSGTVKEIPTKQILQEKQTEIVRPAMQKIENKTEIVEKLPKREKSPPVEKKVDSRKSPPLEKKNQNKPGEVLVQKPNEIDENVIPKKSTKGRQSEQQNTMVFNFCNRTETPSYVEDVKRAPTKQIYSKKDSGITFISPSAAESSDFVEQDAEENSSPPPVCNVVFVNDNIIINGRSNIRKKSKTKKLNISFNDEATLLHEYPSELSLLENLTSEDASSLESANNLVTSSVDNSGSLSSYTPSKVQIVETFELGISRASSLTPTPETPVVLVEEEIVEEFLRPLEDGASFSTGSSSDLLF